METEFKAIHSAKTTLAEAEEGKNEVKPVFYREEECILREPIFWVVSAKSLSAFAGRVPPGSQPGRGHAVIHLEIFARIPLTQHYLLYIFGQS
jgi:hypothetical protein